MAAAWEGCTEARQSSFEPNRCVLQRVRTRRRCLPQGPSAKLAKASLELAGMALSFLEKDHAVSQQYRPAIPTL